MYRVGVFIWVVIIGFTAPCSSLYAQIVISGFITDQSNGSPLADANVVLQDSARNIVGTVSNVAGFYSLSDVRAGTHVLQVTFVGYAPHRDTLTIQDESSLVLNVTLVPTDESFQEILIVSEREGGAARVKAGMQKVRPRDLSRIPTPGPTGDLATYLQILPGVVSLGDRGGQLFIRGGTPSQNLILVDGMLIYNPFHILGFFSAFPEDLISNVDVYAGGFGAEYSGRISSVIDVTMRGGNNQHIETGTSISPFLSSIRVEGPLRRGQLSLLGSLRHSTIERIAPFWIGQELPMLFNDWFVKLQHNGKSSRCSAAIMRTYDRGQVDADRNNIFRWSNTLLGGQCVGSTPGSGIFSKINASFTYTSNAIGSANNPERTANAWRINVDGDFALTKDEVGYRWGFFGRSDYLNYDLQELFVGFRADEDVLHEFGGHMSVSYSGFNNMIIDQSLAVAMSFSFPATFEPRLRLTWQPWGSSRQEMNVAVGIYKQPLIGINDERDAGSVFTLWLPSPLGGARASAVHALTGWSQTLGAFDFSVETYLKRLRNLPVPIWSSIASFTTTLTLANGVSYGADTRIEFQRNGFYGYIGYGYAWTEYESEQGNFGMRFGTPVQHYHPPHDRRHQLNTVASLDLGRFNMSVRWQFGSGLPFTQPYGFDSMIFFPGLLQRVDRDYGTPRILYDKPYEGRLPTYHRLDLTVEYTATSGDFDLSIQAGAMNVYDRTNLFYYDVFSLRRVDQLPFTPYVGLKIETK